MIDLARDQHGRFHARPRDLASGRSRPYSDWIVGRCADSRTRVQAAALDRLGNYGSAVDAELTDVTAVFETFEVVKPGI